MATYVNSRYVQSGFRHASIHSFLSSFVCSFSLDARWYAVRANECASFSFGIIAALSLKLQLNCFIQLD